MTWFNAQKKEEKRQIQNDKQIRKHFVGTLKQSDESILKNIKEAQSEIIYGSNSR